MGRLESSHEPEAVINHKSHSHPLYLTNHQPNQQTLTLTPPCAGCKHKLVDGSLIYTCKTCKYSLHLHCSQLPPQIKHPFHKDHALSLIYESSYPNGIFSCDGCGKHGHGFSYNCKICEIDLHVTCASLPLLLSHPSHSQHQLKLTFSPPYDEKTFVCDVCGRMSGDHWLYRCDLCGFDSHLSCPLTSAQQAPSQAQGNYNRTETTMRSRPHQVQDQSHAVGVPYGANPNYGHALFNPPGIFNGHESMLLNQMINSGSSGASQALVQAMMGGGGDFMDGLNLWRAFTGGGGGGSSQLLQMMMGGGGGLNNQLLQAMITGGVGGGSGTGDLFQALIGGGIGGGGGGLDLIGGLGWGSMLGLGGFGGFGF